MKSISFLGQSPFNEHMQQSINFMRCSLVLAIKSTPVSSVSIISGITEIRCWSRMTASLFCPHPLTIADVCEDGLGILFVRAAKACCDTFLLAASMSATVSCEVGTT
ncbi:hypothetical protein D3C71_1186730 [compost metagenome]